MRTFSTATALLAITLLGACTPQSQAGGNPYPPVPPPVSEVIPKPPVAGEQLVWQPGHWDWSGGGYIWARGQYVTAAGHGNLWMQGWWVRTDAGWTWQPAHWTA